MPKEPKCEPVERSRRFLALLKKLVNQVEIAAPGFEFDGAGSMLEELTRLGQELGLRIVCATHLIGSFNVPEHRRNLLLSNPATDFVFELPLYSFTWFPPVWHKGNPVIGRTAEGAVLLGPLEPAEAAQIQAERSARDAAEYEAVRANRVRRHITTADERARLLTHLRLWIQEAH